MNLDTFGFKAKNKRTGLWEFACLNNSNCGCYGVTWDISETESYYYSDIYPETLCQCTGLKDSEGNLIYENDILEIETVDGNQTGNVYYQELIPSFRVWLPMYTTIIPALMSLAEMTGKKVRVIGNKFGKEMGNEH